MIRVNKNLFKFTLLATLLGAGVLQVLSKFLPLFFEHSVYFCQQFINSFSIHIPSQLGNILLAVLGGIVLMIVYKLLTIYLEVQRLKKNLVTHEKQNHSLYKLFDKLHLKDNVLVIASEKPFAFCVGIRKQKIYLSTALVSLMSKKELEAILLHERYHLHNKDTLILFIASVLKMVFPFFPVISDLLTQYKINREIEADFDAVKKLGGTTPIISVLEKFLTIPALSYATTSAIADYETLEPRIYALLKNKKTSAKLKFKLGNALISFLSIGILGMIIIAPVNAVQMKMPDQDATMLCLQGDACAAWCKTHNTVMPYSQSTKANYSSATNSLDYSPVK